MYELIFNWNTINNVEEKFKFLLTIIDDINFITLDPNDEVAYNTYISAFCALVHNTSSFELLLNSGCNVTGTAIHKLISRNNWDLIKILPNYIGMKQHINTPNKKGNTPLHYAIKHSKRGNDSYGPFRRKKCDMNIIQLLLDNGANPTIRNNDGENVMEYAMKFALPIKAEPISSWTCSHHQYCDNDALILLSQHMTINEKTFMKLLSPWLKEIYVTNIKQKITTSKFDDILIHTSGF
jgi:hypothetical protein